MISRRQFFLRSLVTGAGVATSSGFTACTRPNVSSTLCNGYARLLPARPSTVAGSEVEQGLKFLALKMSEENGGGARGDMVAGYTYLGQFIDHDLTRNITPLDAVTADVERTTNFRTAFLDLDQLYGGGPSISPFLYRRRGSDSFEGAERFLLGATTPSNMPDGTHLPSSCNDLPRNSQGIALVGDARQDENLILAQLQGSFLRLHNLILDNPKLLAGSPHYDIKPSFEAARRIVTWHYQWLVRNDFLKTILDPEVFSRLDSNKYKSMITGRPTDFRIPVEFSAAAFRFGHSMVRNDYLFNIWHDANVINDLLGRTGFGPPGNVPLPEEWVINWKRFFIFPGHFFDAQPAQKIDTNIASDLFKLPFAQIRAFSLAATSKSTFLADPAELPIRTLLRGARMGLPSGQDVERVVRSLEPRARFLTTDEIVAGNQQDILKDDKYGFYKNTPLWYYILKEAEVLGHGNHLGPVGSHLVGDVIIAALTADPKSYINVAGPEWVPTLWRHDLEKEPLEEMQKLLLLVSPELATTACSNT